MAALVDLAALAVLVVIFEIIIVSLVDSTREELGLPFFVVTTLDNKKSARTFVCKQKNITFAPVFT